MKTTLKWPQCLFIFFFFLGQLVLARGQENEGIIPNFPFDQYNPQIIYQSLNTEEILVPSEDILVEIRMKTIESLSCQKISYFSENHENLLTQTYSCEMNLVSLKKNQQFKKLYSIMDVNEVEVVSGFMNQRLFVKIAAGLKCEKTISLTRPGMKTRTSYFCVLQNQP